jgi:hypothetical protein
MEKIRIKADLAPRSMLNVGFGWFHGPGSEPAVKNNADILDRHYPSALE